MGRFNLSAMLVFVWRIFLLQKMLAYEAYLPFIKKGKSKWMT